MKKKIALWGAIFLLLCTIIFIMPNMVESSIPSVYYVTPNRKTYENTIYCSGTLQSTNVQEIILQSLVVPDKVHVSVGDYVKQGDLLTTINQQATKQLSASPQELIRDVSGGLLHQSTAGNIDWLGLASSYGLSAVMGGDITPDIRQILSQAGLMPDSTATQGTIVGGGESQPPLHIKAPIEGVITELSLRKDVPAVMGQAIATITDTGQYKVLVAVNEGDIAKIKVGDSAKIHGVGFGGHRYQGTVSKIYPTAHRSLYGSSAETVVDVEITLHQPDKHLKPGFSAKVEIVGGNQYSLITVPYEAIRQDENNNEYVYTYQDGKLTKNPVITGQELIKEVEILDGLSPDSIVVYNPSSEVKEGMMIHIRGRANVD